MGLLVDVLAYMVRVVIGTYLLFTHQRTTQSSRRQRFVKVIIFFLLCRNLLSAMQSFSHTSTKQNRKWKSPVTINLDHHVYAADHSSAKLYYLLTI